MIFFGSSVRCLGTVQTIFSKWTVSILLMLTAASTSAQSEKLTFYNPALDVAPVMNGQLWPERVIHFYDRLPGNLVDQVRKPLWDLSRNASGLQLRFTTNASRIVVRYAVEGPIQMQHMPATGVSGIDLYAKGEKDQWLWAGGRATFRDTVQYVYEHLDPGTKEFVLYLPLYNSIRWLEIGVPESCDFTPLPRIYEKPVIVYGTSIAQGACASRPGLAWTNILSRRLHQPVVNLGFSGNGRLEPALINLMSASDASIYVLDCLPNMTEPYMPPDTLQFRIINAVMTLKRHHPNVPVLLAEHCGYAGEGINQTKRQEYANANSTLHRAFDILKREGFKKIFILSKIDIG